MHDAGGCWLVLRTSRRARLGLRALEELEVEGMEMEVQVPIRVEVYRFRLVLAPCDRKARIRSRSACCAQ